MNLQLSLKRQWFEMTDSGEKTEDYRDINPYWIKRLLDLSQMPIEEPFDFRTLASDIVFDIENGHDYDLVLESFFVSAKPFTTNTMTLGYPKKGDTEKTRVYEHAGIEIRTGNPEWGAEPNKIYFVIKHGKRIN